MSATMPSWTIYNQHTATATQAFLDQEHTLTHSNGQYLNLIHLLLNMPETHWVDAIWDSATAHYHHTPIGCTHPEMESDSSKANYAVHVQEGDCLQYIWRRPYLVLNMLSLHI